MVKIVGIRRLCKLLVELVSTDFCNNILTNSTDNYILSACVRRALLWQSPYR